MPAFRRMAIKPSASPLVVAGWSIFARSLFLDQIDALIAEVERLREKHPVDYVNRNATKRLTAIAQLAFETIPEDPARQEYRQGTALGKQHKHWFRAVFFQQYRLFFRYRHDVKIIVLAWVNDADTKRAYESNSDAYRVFRKMLGSGHPPDDWDALLAQASAATSRLRQAAGKIKKRR